MSVILEGFDNSGKSTLAEMLKRDAEATVYYPGPKPVGIRDIRRQMRQQAEWASEPSAVLDRVTIFSQYAYSLGDTRQMLQLAFASLMEMRAFMRTIDNSLVVYCRPPIEKILDFSTHQIKSYDDHKKLRWLEANAERIVQRYDNLFKSFPHVVWDYTDPAPELYQQLIWRLS